MSGEEKKTTTDNKIVSLHITDSDIENPQMDQFIRDSLKKEADEIERRLNEDPALADVEAPEGLFQSIVGELKAQGAWEEDEEAAAAPKTPEEVYDMLSEDDRKALELGRSMEKKRRERAERQLRRHRAMKIAGAAAAMAALVFGLSMTSEANRRLVVKMWDGVLENFMFRVNTDYSGDKDSVRSKSKEEIEAIEAIREKFGGQMIELGYLPEGMYYERYDIMDQINEATIVYSYRDTFFYVTIIGENKEGANYYIYDNEASFKEEVTNNFGITAEIWEINIGMGKEAYITDIENEGKRYVLNGVVSLEEMKNIFENVLIF